jgi:MFS family permease
LNRALRTILDSFSPLRLRPFRIYLGGQAISLIGTWMQLTAQSWVVWELSHSTAALGIVGMLGQLPFLLLGPWAGVWADRLDRRRVLIVTQIIAMLQAFTLALLLQSGLVRLWHVYLMAALLGCVATLDRPAQQAFLGDLSGIEHVRKAVNLNVTIIEISRVLGPSFAGWLIGTLGVASGFWLNGVSFLAVIVSLLMVTAHKSQKPPAGKPLEEFREGLSFIFTRPRIQDLMLFTIFVTFFGFSNLQILPAFATDVLHRGPETLGLLMGASGAGALVSALVIIPLAQRARRTGVMLASCIVWSGLAYSLFSRVTWIPLAAGSVFLAGMVIPIVMTSAMGLLQTMAPPEMRGRLLSAWSMVSQGLQPFATLAVGFGAQALGPQTAVLINGILAVAGAGLMLALRPGLSTWEANSPGLAHEDGGERIAASH